MEDNDAEQMEKALNGLRGVIGDIERAGVIAHGSRDRIGVSVKLDDEYRATEIMGFTLTDELVELLGSKLDDKGMGEWIQGQGALRLMVSGPVGTMFLLMDPPGGRELVN